MSYTMQEAFSIVESHLLTQEQPSIEEGQCKYHYNGLKCAVGCLISEEDYTPILEGVCVANLPESLLEKIIGRDWETLDMLSELQDTHDCVSVSNWKDSLDYIASKYKLKTSNIQLN